MTNEPMHDTRGVPLPSTMWALWDDDGALARHRRFDAPMESHEVVEAFGWPPRHAPYTIAEFTGDRWAEMEHAIGTGADTSSAAWAA